MIRPVNAELIDEIGSHGLVCDGAMGTELMRRGLQPGDCGMRWNAVQPDDVFSVHEAYALAGCRLITTNSFGGNRKMLARHGAEDSVGEWNRLAAELARKAAAAAPSRSWVLGDIGPSGDFLEPYGDTTPEELRAVFIEQALALAGGGADAFLVETMSDPAEAVVALEACAEAAAHLPRIATFAFQKAGESYRTMMGATPADAVLAAAGAGASLIGANCGTDLGFDDYLRLAGELVAAAGSLPVILQPNAGAPENSPSGTVYRATPEDVAAAALRIRTCGVRVIGGCCGTTPAHLNAVATTLKGSVP